MRTPTSLNLRLLAWLGLGLMLSASTPHLHHANTALESHAKWTDTASLGAGSVPSVSPDKHHEEHSARLPRETHACGLCRSLEEQPAVRARSCAIAWEEIPGLPLAETTPNLVASLFASLHPARAPPLLLDA